MAPPRARDLARDLAGSPASSLGASCGAVALRRGGLGEPWRLSVAGAAEGMAPTTAAVAAAAAMVSPPGLHVPVSSGEWANAVLAVTPYLDAQQLQQAISILDRALASTQQVAAASAAQRGALLGHQKQLFAELQFLGLAAGFSAAAALQGFPAVPAPVPAAVPAAAPAGHPHPWAPPTAPPVCFGPPPGLEAVGAAEKSSPDVCLPRGPSLPTLLKPCLPRQQMQSQPEKRQHQQQPPQQQRSPESGAAAKPPPRAAEPAGGAAVGGGGRTGDKDAQTLAAKGAQTLSSSLRLLAGEDPDCLFIVRRINKLGFKASKILRQHFSAHGQVVRVLVAHSTVRQGEQCSGQVVRRRPSSLGFVQMQTAAAVRRALEQGSEQEIKGAAIRVQRFEHKATLAACEEEGDNEFEALEAACSQWQRSLSAASVASCATTASVGSSRSSATVVSLEHLL